jgi:hypothetical protein
MSSCQVCANADPCAVLMFHYGLAVPRRVRWLWSWLQLENVSPHVHQTMVLQSRDTRLIIMVCKICIICEGTAPTALSGGAKHVCENCVKKPVSDALCRCKARNRGEGSVWRRTSSQRMPRWQARRIRHPSSSQETAGSQGRGGHALVPKLKHGTDDIWYIKYFIALWNPRTG